MSHLSGPELVLIIGLGAAGIVLISGIVLSLLAVWLVEYVPVYARRFRGWVQTIRQRRMIAA